MSTREIQEVRDRLLCDIATGISLILTRQITEITLEEGIRVGSNLEKWAELTKKTGVLLTSDATDLAKHYTKDY
jgi:hypothetical protein